jgi:hypothetical protein
LEDATLVLGKDNLVYGTIGGTTLFHFDASKNVVNHVTTGAQGLTKDDFGNLYYYSETTLNRFTY